LGQLAAEAAKERWETGEGPVRRCALTRERRPKETLIRFVLDPESIVVPDLKERLPGRGVWLTATRDCVAEGAKRNIFAAAFKTKVKVPQDLAAQVESRLQEAALGALALANKAGEIVFGFGKVEEAIEKARVLALLHASEASEDGCRKLDGKFRAKIGADGPEPLRAFSSNELGLASGRTNVIHAAVIHGGAAEKLIAAASRLERYRKGLSAFADPTGSDTDRE
jgi:predicted RNA-binding protein YlxR (DUF448 family)